MQKSIVLHLLVKSQMVRQVECSKDHSKRLIHHKYKIWCSQKGLRAIALRSFQMFWNKHLPYIVVQRGSNSFAIPDADLEKRTDVYLDSENHDDDVALNFGFCDNNVSQSDLLLNETVTYSVENHTSAEHEPFFFNRGTSIASVLSPDSADVHNQELTNSTSTCFNSNAPDKLTPSEILVTIVPSTRAARFCNSSEDNTPSDSLLPASISLPSSLWKQNPSFQILIPQSKELLRLKLVKAIYFSLSILLCNLR